MKSNPLLAQFTVILIAIIGVVVIYKARREDFYLPTLAVAATLTVFSFGAWWWTEIMYDRLVIHSLPRLHGTASSKGGSGTAGESKLPDAP